MDLRSAPGFLGSNASLLADITLVVFILLLILMLAGFYFARRKMFVPYHKITMTTIVIIIWIFIAFNMAVTYTSLVHDAGFDLSQTLILVPTIHLIVGGIAQILGTILLIRMWFEKQLPKALRFEPIKPWMRLTLTLWIINIVLGIGIYQMFYGWPFSKH